MLKTWSIRACMLALVTLFAMLPHSAFGSRVVRLDAFGGLAGLFNLAQGTVRIVSIISPTCPSCRKALGDISAVMSEFPTTRLRAYVVFVPQDEDDSVFRALERVKEFDERRAVYFWDAGGVVRNAWADIVESETPLWHMLALYDTDAQFRDAPAPGSWVHMHDHADSPPLERTVLAEHVRVMLDRLEAMRRDAGNSEKP